MHVNVYYYQIAFAFQSESTVYYDHDCGLQEMKYMLPDKFIRGSHSINFSKFGSRTFIIGNNTDTNDQSFGQFNRLDSLIK